MNDAPVNFEPKPSSVWNPSLDQLRRGMSAADRQAGYSDSYTLGGPLPVLIVELERERKSGAK